MSEDDFDPHCADDSDDFAECPICSGEMEFETCWQCQGEGCFHNCGEDCCPCLHPELDLDPCEECNGEGGYLLCAALPHSDAQMEDGLAKEK